MRSFIKEIRSSEYGKHLYDRIEADKSFKVHVLFNAKAGAFQQFFSGRIEGGSPYLLSFSDKHSNYLLESIRKENQRSQGKKWLHPEWVALAHEIYHAYQNQYGQTPRTADKEIQAVRFQNYVFSNNPNYQAQNLRLGYFDGNIYDKASFPIDKLADYLNKFFEIQKHLIPSNSMNFQSRLFIHLIPRNEGKDNKFKPN